MPETKSSSIQLSPGQTGHHDHPARVTTQHSTTREHPPTVLVLASGRGERFRASGGTVHKLKARLGERSVLEHTLAAVRDSGLPWHLEDAGHPGMGDTIAAAVRATPNAAGWLILPGDLPLVRPATLLALAGALSRPGIGGHDTAEQRTPTDGRPPSPEDRMDGASSGVDAPLLAPLHATPMLPTGYAVVPVHAGAKGHPVGFSPSCRDALLDLRGEQGAARIVRHLAAQGRVNWFETNDAGTVTDIDTLQDLHRAAQCLEAVGSAAATLDPGIPAAR